jgi:HK97 family phage portal protein
MSLWTRLFATRPAKREITYDQIARTTGLLDAPARTGIHVTEQTALAVSAVWCAVNAISSSIASLPLTLYRRTGDTQEEAREHPLAAVLDIEPNPESTARVFWESFIANALLHGQGLAEIERDGSGRPVRLWPVHPTASRVANAPSGSGGSLTRYEQTNRNR